MHRLWFVPIVCFVSLVSVGPAAGETPLGMDANAAAMAEYLKDQANLPLAVHSDWINVKTDPAVGAKGDGKADDTAALQKALALLSRGAKDSRKVLYLPPGTYRITKTLTVTSASGGAIYGHGRATRIVWDGQEGRRMVHSNGFVRCLYLGLTFDGRGKALVGVDHDSKTLYETRVRYQYCAFRNFTDSGIRVGHDQKQASAEMMFMDCLFEDCRRGISFLQFNDYDEAVIRCIFRRCGSGVHGPLR